MAVSRRPPAKHSTWRYDPEYVPEYVMDAVRRFAARFGWWAFVTFTWQRIYQHNLSALAAAAAFYALLAIFPTLTAVVSLYGLVVDPAMAERQVAALEGVLPPEALKLVATWLQALVQGPIEKFRIGLLVGVLLASSSVWSTTVMMMNAINTCYGDEETRGFVRFNIEAVVLGVGLVLFGVAAITLVAVVPVLLDSFHTPQRWHAVISLVRRPTLAALAIAALAIVYRYLRARVLRKWEWITRGAATATVLWLIGSIVFSCYVSQVSSYDKTYGSLGAVIVLLLWFYMTAYIILIGAELNAEAERHAASPGFASPEPVRTKPLGHEPGANGIVPAAESSDSPRVMAGEGRPATTSFRATSEVVDAGLHRP